MVGAIKKTADVAKSYKLARYEVVVASLIVCARFLGRRR